MTFSIVMLTFLSLDLFEKLFEWLLVAAVIEKLSLDSEVI